MLQKDWEIMRSHFILRKLGITLIESFTSTIKLYKGTDLVLIIGGLTSAVLVITGIGLILWMLNRRRQVRDDTGPIKTK